MLHPEFAGRCADAIRATLHQPEADDNAVVAVTGVGSLYPFVRVSDLVAAVAPDVRGRLVVFFPGELENNNYRLLDARDGWNYHAVAITDHEGERAP